MDIASMLEVEVQEVADSKENVTPVRKPQSSYPCQTFSKEENDFYKLTYGSEVASVRFLRLHCTGCDEHIGSAPAEAHNMHEHPVLRTLLCAKCREFYGDGTFEQGDDATDMFCRWCANGGNLYCCSYCSNTFCSKCIKRNLDPPTIKRIEAEDSWKCFVCDPKDLYPLRSIARALITHIETVTRILENDRRMSPKDVEEKMHLDETKCCSRKRKRRRRRTLSNSDDDEEEDLSYVPEVERPDTPPVKKRKVRRDTVRNFFSNGYFDHEYFSNKRKTKIESDLDPSDLMIPCEQTMIEGDTEIINPSDVEESSRAEPQSSPATDHTSLDRKNISKPQKVQQFTQPQQQLQPQQQPQKRQLQKILPNSAMSINPVPLANLLKVAISSGAKKIKVTHTPNKLVAVPVSVVPKAVASSSISFVKPTTHFLVPKNMAKNLQQQSPIMQSQQIRTVANKSPPSIIDLDSDDEPVVVENNSRLSNHYTSIPKTIIDEIDMTEENVIPDQIDCNSNNNDEDEPVVLSEPNSSSPMIMASGRTRITGTSRTTGDEPPTITIDGVIPLKTQQRDQRFKKMLKLQYQEIDNTVGELKTKILKLIQVAENTKPQQGADPLSSAALCTKRFHRALRKTLVELSHINDRMVRDYVHWKKKTDKALATVKEEQTKETGTEPTNREDEVEETKKSDVSSKASVKDDIPLEMVCERESASESEDDDFDENILDNGDRTVETIGVPLEFSQILDHLSIFKKKPMSVKAVGDSSVDTADKGCQVYDVPWKDYEKCIGYSLLTKSEYDSTAKKELFNPVAMPDENFGKYQEQYLFYLQHIEDFGIETDEMKGLPDPNHIPLKDLIDSTSPFIMDMLERLSPVALSNGCISPTQLTSSKDDPDVSVPLPLPPVSMAMDTSSPPPTTNAVTTDETTENDLNISEENVAATSKAVEELVKMVTKLSEDLRSEKETVETETNKQTIEPEVDNESPLIILDDNDSEKNESEASLFDKETISAVNSILDISDSEKKEIEESDIDMETISAVNSILDFSGSNNNDDESQQEQINDCASTANDNECTTLN